MDTSNWIAIASTIIAIGALVYSWASNTKKYEVTDQYRKNVLIWYEEVIKILITLRMSIEASKLTDKDKIDLLSNLSAQIEIGRFFFPNINKGNSYGQNKPLPYRGYRHIVLEFVVMEFNLFKKEDAKKYLLHAVELQRQFTAHIFELLDPVGFNKSIHRFTDVTFGNDIILEEFLEKDPQSFVFYRKL